MIWDASTLARLSAPGFNRAIGAGDVVPYWGPRPGQTVGDAGEATPGVTYDPNAFAATAAGPTASPGGDSVLNNLSALTPILNQIIQQQQQAAIVSGQGNAQANPGQAATPGLSSTDVATQLGGLPIAGAQTTPGLSTPTGSAGSDSGVAAGSGTAGVASSAGDAGVAGVGTGGAVGTGEGTAGGVGGTGGVGAPGSASSGTDSGAPAGAAGPGETGGEASSGGGGGAGGGAGGTILVTYTLRHIHANSRRAIAYWMRVRENFRALPGGEARYQHYQTNGARIIEQIERLPDDEKHHLLERMHAVLVAPFTRRAQPEDTEGAIRYLMLVCAGLIYTLKMDVVEA